MSGHNISEGFCLRVKTPSGKIQDIEFYANSFGLNLKSRSIPISSTEREFESVSDLMGCFREIYDPLIDQDIKILEFPEKRMISIQLNSGRKLSIGLTAILNSRESSTRKLLMSDTSRRYLEKVWNNVESPDFDGISPDMVMDEVFGV